MKKLLFTFLLLVSVVNAFAAIKVMNQKTVKLPIDLSSLKLKFSNLGYGETYFVKIIVPELAGETFLNHRNLGEDGPCLFTYDANHVDDVLQSSPELIETNFKITLSKLTSLDGDKCIVTLQEDIETVVRGFKFIHTKYETLPSRVAADCK
jgi:hypothetical protein